jgi:hypothetical protein
MSWWHPGFRGLGIFKKVFREIRPDISKIIRDRFKILAKVWKPFL